MNSALTNSCIMLTGGAGFIGSHLLRNLLQQHPRRVFVLDNFSTGKEAHLPRDPRIEVLRFDLGQDDIGLLSKAVRESDYLVHLAAIKHSQTDTDPQRILQVNVNGAYELFEAAASSGIKKIIFSSSVYVYGHSNRVPFVESGRTVPETVYGVAKLSGEYLLRCVAERYRTDFNVLRYFFVYGPRYISNTGYKTFICKSFERILRGESVVVFGDGRQVLDYIFIDDVVSATVEALLRGPSGATLNIGSGSGAEIGALAGELIAVGQTAAEIDYGPSDWTHGTSRVADIGFAETNLIWSPKIALPEGLRRVFDWMREREETPGQIELSI